MKLLHGGHKLHISLIIMAVSEDPNLVYDDKIHRKEEQEVHYPCQNIEVTHRLGVGFRTKR